MLHTYLMIAAIIWPDGVFQPLNPSVTFDKAACLTSAHDVNQRWLTAGITGIATCQEVNDSQGTLGESAR
jgi:hypothetical protein